MKATSIPLTILSTLPSAGVGAILALLLTGNDLGVVALIGIILLIGIVKKNAIMMIDFALEAERVEHKPPEEAIFQACLLRFRPIMMTTMAALLGGLASGARIGHRFGVAPSAGNHDCRRLAGEPVAYSLHHAGCLPLVRPAGTAFFALEHWQPDRGAEWRFGGLSSHEYFRAIYQASHRHFAAGDGAAHGGSAGL